MNPNKFSMNHIKDMDKFVITEVSRSNRWTSLDTLGSSHKTRINNGEEVSLKIIVKDNEYLEKLIEMPSSIKIISGILNNTLYIFKNCMVSSYDITYGHQDKIINTNIDMYATEVTTFDDIKVKFTDKIHKVCASDLAIVYEEYGNPEGMSYDEFCQKCLAVKI